MTTTNLFVHRQRCTHCILQRRCVRCPCPVPQTPWVGLRNSSTRGYYSIPPSLAPSLPPSLSPPSQPANRHSPISTHQQTLDCLGPWTRSNGQRQMSWAAKTNDHHISHSIGNPQTNLPDPSHCVEPDQHPGVCVCVCVYV